MSKMPAKKKSCFQITSVTTAQAASSITEDTESLDDPDESRTEDVSSEIFDVSRATDYGPEDVVERSSSEETLNNVGGEPDTPGTVSPNVQQEAPLRSSTAAPLPSACSSRFRVIKLDHGSGEPYRRGRWTCTEFYDRDSDSAVITRTGDSARHYEHGAPERDSGLGADSLADASLTAVSQLLSRPLGGAVYPPQLGAHNGPFPYIPQGSRSNSLIPAAGLPGSVLPQPLDDRRKSEPLPQPPMPLISDKAFGKVALTDPLTNPLHLPVFGLPLPVDGEDDSSTSANVVAIDNKIEQAMDLVKSHLMYAVREEVEVLKEQIKELIEKNSTLERENALLKSLSNSDQLSQLSTQVGPGSSQQPPPVTSAPHTAPQTAHPPQQPNVSSA